MHGQNLLGLTSQGSAPLESFVLGEYGPQSLGNSALQKSTFADITFASTPSRAADREARRQDHPLLISPSHRKLEALKAARFSASRRAERIAKSLTALRREGSIHVTAEDWESIALDDDLEDQF